MIRIANAPCSWGVIEGIAGERSDYVKVINEISETGYSGTELGDWGFMPTDPMELRSELDARGLALTGSWVSVNLEDPTRHKASADDAVRTAKQLARVGGPETAVVLGNDPYGNPVRTKFAGRATPEIGMTDEQWATFAKGADYVAGRVRDEAGIRTVFHQHIGTFVETMAEAQRLLDKTDPSLLGLCLDTGHWTFGTGGDPEAAIRDFGDRIWLVHFKDLDPSLAARSRTESWDGPTSVAHGVFCELGKGCVDFPGVLAALAQRGYEGWIVIEQDVVPGLGTPRESAKRNREYLRSIGV
jgi:inosose dehydratase